MNLFKLYKDVKYTSWDRLYYEVEAETIEDAVKKIIDGDVEEYDIEALDEYETLTLKKIIGALLLRYIVIIMNVYIKMEINV